MEFSPFSIHWHFTCHHGVFYKKSEQVRPDNLRFASVSDEERSENNMTSEDVIELIEKKYGEKAAIHTFEQKPVLFESGHTHTLKEHLHRAFTVRLNNSKENDDDPEYDADISSFLTDLEQLPSDTPLIAFLALSDLSVYSGWATQEKVIHWTKMDRKNIPNHVIDPTR
jgi:hypothetical protein